MKPELRERIIAFNKQASERKEKAEDLDRLLQSIQPVLLKIASLLPDELKAILEKHGFSID